VLPRADRRHEGATDSERALKSQKLVLELLLSDMPETAYTRTTRSTTGRRSSASANRASKARDQPVANDLSHPAISVNLDACIQCTRCLRACRDEQVNDVIGLAFRGAQAKIVFDMDDAMGASTCVACGECVQACPTGALAPARVMRRWRCPTSSVDSVCPYCGVGCQLTYHVKDDQIVFVEGRPGPANQERLCVKGRYGFDYARHPQRLTVPLIRRADAPKDRRRSTPTSLRWTFREATWDEALSSLPAAAHIRDRTARSAGRLRLGQGQQRRGLPVPEAGAHRLRQQQRRPLHAAVPRLQRGGAAGRHRFGRGVATR
jgi:formate dehydrogenase major subunit